MSDKVAQYLHELAQQLGVAVSHIYGVMIRQAIVSGIANTALNIAVIILFPIIFTKLFRLTLQKWDDIRRTELEVMVVVCGMIATLAGVIMMMAAICTLPDAILSIFNPEYYVVKDVLEAFK